MSEDTKAFMGIAAAILGIVAGMIMLVMFTTDKITQYQCAKFGENTQQEVHYETIDACYLVKEDGMIRTNIEFEFD